MEDRIPESTLPANYVNGVDLDAADLNKIVSVLRAGVNYNKNDIDVLAAGFNTNYLFSTVADANAYLLTTTPLNGRGCIIMYGGVDEDIPSLYRYNEGLGEWVFIGAVYDTLTNTTSVALSATVPELAENITIWYEIVE